MTIRTKTRAQLCALIGLLAAAWWLCDAFLVAPQFGQTDIYYFKEAGINFAQGLGLKTRFTYGNPSFDYKDYAHYPPLYPWLFGMYCKIAGVSVAANQAFNSLISLFAGLLGFACLRGTLISTGRGTAAQIGIAALCVVLGYYGFAYDRPDGLGAVFGMAALLCTRGTRTASAIAAGGLSVLALFTSPYAGVLTALLAGIGLLASPDTRAGTACRSIGALGGALIGAALLLLCLSVFLPGWFDGFLGVASGANTHNETGGGYFLALMHGEFRYWWSGLPYGKWTQWAPLVKLGAVAVALAVSIVVRRAGGTPWLALSAPIALLLVSPLCLVLTPYQSNYPGLTAALLLAAWALIEQGPSMPRWVAACMLAAFAANAVLGLANEGRDLLLRTAARGSLQRELRYLTVHRDELKDGYSAASPSNYMLWRQLGLHPLINIFSGFKQADARVKIGTLELSFPGSGDPLLPQYSEFFPMTEYSAQHVPPLPQVASFLGQRVSRSSQTWESALYVRASESEHSAMRMSAPIAPMP